MVTVAHTVMSTEPLRMSTPINDQILTVMQWLSPAFPIGSFAYSHGLEWAISTGCVIDAATLESWITDVLEYGSGRTDAIILALAVRGVLPFDKLNAMSLALCASQERLSETQAQGEAMGKVMRDVWKIGCEEMVLPVALGAAAAHRSIPVDLIVPAYLHAFSSNLISVAVRLVPVGQTQGQRVLLALHPLIDALAQVASNADLDDLTSCTFLSDVASMRHETQIPRIFKT
jgi:urease accessory protein